MRTSSALHQGRMSAPQSNPSVLQTLGDDWTRCGAKFVFFRVPGGYSVNGPMTSVQQTLPLGVNNIV
jgi:hypothetical protein